MHYGKSSSLTSISALWAWTFCSMSSASLTRSVSWGEYSLTTSSLSYDDNMALIPSRSWPKYTGMSFNFNSVQSKLGQCNTSKTFSAWKSYLRCLYTHTNTREQYRYLQQGELVAKSNFLIKESTHCPNVNLITAAWLRFTYFWTYCVRFAARPNQCTTFQSASLMLLFGFGCTKWVERNTRRELMGWTRSVPESSV